MSSPSAPGTLILNSGSLIYMDPAAREQTGCAPDASLAACEPRIRSIMEDLRTTSSNTHTGSASSNGADGADAIRPVDASSKMWARIRFELRWTSEAT